MLPSDHIFVNDDDTSSRQELLRYYNSKVTSHIGYLITAILALLGIQTGKISEFLIFKPMFFVAILVSSMVYFLGRAFYWTRMSSSIFYVKTYSQETIIKLNREFEPVNGRFVYNQLEGLNLAIIDFNLRQGVWKDLPIKKHHYYLFKLFGGWTGKKLLIILILFFMILFYFLKFSVIG
jgi:hypothetical protein